VGWRRRVMSGIDIKITANLHGRKEIRRFTVPTGTTYATIEQEASRRFGHNERLF